MYQKICNALSIVASVASISLIGGGTFGYFWITNEDNQKMLQDKITEKVMGSIKMPSLSSPALPTAQPKAAGSAGGFSIPKF